jgi:L-seryl-tRNA(Ser) seleniumtransferase
VAELTSLGRKRNLIVIDDIGSGALADFAEYGIAGEPVASESVKCGADVVLFSGDKLLGGPQCGIIVGRKTHVEKITRHPLMRALRVDKITLAALVETLRLHGDREQARRALPLEMLLSAPLANLQNRAQRMAPQLAACGAISEAEPLETHTYLGGGSLPGQEIPTWCVAVKPAKGNVDGLARVLRTGTPSIFGRIRKDRLLFDLRSVLPAQDMQIVEVVERLKGSEPDSSPEQDAETPQEGGDAE